MATMRGLVDHDHLTRGRSRRSGLPLRRAVVEELGHRVGRDPGLFGQDPGGDGGDGQAPHRGAARPPRRPGRRGPFGSCPAPAGPDHAGESLAAFTDPAQGGGLVGSEAVATRRPLDGLGRGDGHAGVAAPDQGVEDLALPGPGSGGWCGEVRRGVHGWAGHPGDAARSGPRPTAAN